MWLVGERADDRRYDDLARRLPADQPLMLVVPRRLAGWPARLIVCQLALFRYPAVVAGRVDRRCVAANDPTAHPDMSAVISGGRAADTPDEGEVDQPGTKPVAVGVGYRHPRVRVRPPAPQHTAIVHSFDQVWMAAGQQSTVLPNARFVCVRLPPSTRCSGTILAIDEAALRLRDSAELRTFPVDQLSSRSSTPARPTSPSSGSSESITSTGSHGPWGNHKRDVTLL